MCGSGFEKKRAFKHLYTKAWLQIRALVHEWTSKTDFTVILVIVIRAAAAAQVPDEGILVLRARHPAAAAHPQGGDGKARWW